jgi:DNA-binding response OmpR family regulator
MAEPTIMSAKILVVDDEPNVLHMVSYVLHAEGFEVVVAQNGAEALSKVQTEVPDLVILDVMMPDMNGAEVCEQLRKRQETLDLPVIMLSALAQVNDKVRCLEAGADEYVTKPIAPEELVARVKALLGRYRQVHRSIPKQPGKVLGFIGAKGGVGTTTVVLNVATVLVMQEKKVVAAEIRPSYGTFSAQLNLVQPQGLVSLLELDPGNISEREVSLHLIDLPSGLRLLVGPQRVAEQREIEPQQLETIIKIITSMADYVILDLPCYPFGANQAAIRCCDLIGLVIEPESTAMMSGIVAVEQLRSWGVQGGRFGAIVVNRAPLTAPIKLDQISAQLGLEIIGAIPNASEVFIAGQHAGLPVVIYRPGSDASRAFSEISKKISPVEGWLRGSKSLPL